MSDEPLLALTHLVDQHFGWNRQLRLNRAFWIYESEGHKYLHKYFVYATLQICKSV
jgi:hypothetical protein